MYHTWPSFVVVENSHVLIPIALRNIRRTQSSQANYVPQKIKDPHTYKYTD